MGETSQMVPSCHGNDDECPPGQVCYAPYYGADEECYYECDGPDDDSCISKRHCYCPYSVPRLLYLCTLNRRKRAESTKKEQKKEEKPQKKKRKNSKHYSKKKKKKKKKS